MTLDEMKSCPREFLIPREVAPLLGCDPYAINVAAKQCPERLGFHVSVIGTRVKIPRLAFIRWMEGAENNDEGRV